MLADHGWCSTTNSSEWVSSIKDVDGGRYQWATQGCAMVCTSIFTRTLSTVSTVPFPPVHSRTHGFSRWGETEGLSREHRGENSKKIWKESGLRNHQICFVEFQQPSSEGTKRSDWQNCSVLIKWKLRSAFPRFVASFYFFRLHWILGEKGRGEEEEERLKWGEGRMKG